MFVPLKIARIFLGSSFWLAAAASQLYLVPAIAGTELSSITLSSSVNPSVLGEPITLSVAIGPAPVGNDRDRLVPHRDETAALRPLCAGICIPMGTVTFYDGITTLGIVPVSDSFSTGIAALTISQLTQGAHSLSASYSGDGSYAPSTSLILAQTVLPSPSPACSDVSGFSNNITLTSSANPSVLSQSITFTAALSSSAARGRVTLYDGTTVLAIEPIFNGQALLFTDQLFPGQHCLRAYYGGSSTTSALTSATLTQVVKASPSQGFLVAPSIRSGLGSSAIVSADFNGDEKTDLAVAGSGVYLGNGDGTFQSPIPLGLGAAPLFVGDFNGDGKPDLAAGSGENAVSILLGNGDGTFQSPLNLPVSYPPYFGLAADFNGDGNVDIAVVLLPTTGGTVGSLAILLGNGNGTFQSPVTYPAGTAPLAVAAGDFNGDGKTDLVTVDGNSNRVNVFLGNGDGTFQSPTFYGVGKYPYSINVGDFNGDGALDLAIADLGGDQVGILLGYGNGTFKSGATLSTGTEPYALAVGDFNGDGILDLATPNQSGNSVSVFTGNGDGTFLSATSYTIGTSPESIAVGDFNSDGRLDLAIPVYSAVDILLGVAPSPDLTINKSHTGNFSQGQTGADYTITVSNIGSLATTGTVNVSDALPMGLTAASISGLGWTCTIVAFSCSRSDSLGTSASYPPILATVNVSPSAPNTVTNSAMVSGGGELRTDNDTASDSTLVIAVAGGQTITFAPIGNQVLGSPPFKVVAVATSGLTVNFTSTTNSVCTVSGATVTLISIGICSITATQGGNATYAAATPVTQTFAVKYPQTVTFGPLSNILLSSPPFPVSASASSGLAVSFTSGTPSVCMVSGSTVTSIAAGTCSITATHAGNASYAAAPPVTQSFTVVGPAIKQGGITPLYSSSTTIQPGSWISIYGTGLASTTATWNGDFPTSLGGVTVMINAKPAYLWYVSSTQINLQAPDDTTIGPVNVVLTNSSGTTISTVTLAPISASFSLLSDGIHVAGVIPTPNGTGAYGGGTYDLVGPTGAFPFSTRPVKQGETLILFGVGFGPTNPFVPAGQVFSSAAPTINPVMISIGGISANVAFAGITEEGLYQFNLTVPNTGSGDQAVQAVVVGNQTQAGPLVTVQ
jgi:uncharacterized protein (TIGR03437 family)